MYPAFDWSVLLRAIMDISAPAGSLADRPQRGHSGHQCSQAPGRPNLHLVSISRRPRHDRRSSAGYQLGDLKLAGFETSTARQHAPGDARQLVGECDCEDVVVQPLLGRLEPGLEPISLPVLRLD